jgi:ferredoxin-NADP reductase
VIRPPRPGAQSGVAPLTEARRRDVTPKAAGSRITRNSDYPVSQTVETTTGPRSLALGVPEADPPLAIVRSEPVADLVVADRRLLAEDVVGLTLVDPDGGELPAWTPGAHVDLELGGTLSRQYSLCGSRADRRSYRIAVLRDPASRGGSVFVHDMLVPGSSVRIRGPRNHFALEPAPAYRFIAGGIGITPILPMIAAVDEAGAEWTLLYGGRRRASLAFLDELSAFGDRVEVCPQDERGLLDLESVLNEPRTDTLVYCCGPEALLAAVEGWCEPWPPGALHVERFAPKPVVAPLAALDSFEVVLQRSGLTLEVPADQTILDACLDAGVDVLSSCEEGACRTCETRVIEGVPDHRDSVLSEAEHEANQVMTICVSRSLTPRLMLDL